MSGETYEKRVEVVESTIMCYNKIYFEFIKL